MRPEPTTGPAPVKRRATTEEDTRTYRFLTYVMGGGVQVREHEKLRDEVTPIRAASLRGQLRFWWRACNPSGCRTIDELRRREGEIWGATSQPSQVIVEVLQQPGAPGTVNVYEYKPGGRIAPCQGMKEIAYGAFPLQPDRDAQRDRRLPGVLFDYGSRAFEVRFSYPLDLADDVKAALWAWETFGGLGARTRRGFGAVLCTNGAPSLDAVRKALQEIRSPQIPGVPSLTGARFEVARNPENGALEAWKRALGLLQDLRQRVGIGRNRSQNNKPAGRSRWPEPDQIRKITGKAAFRHRDPTVSVAAFPRASFGLPIVFHFEAGREGDPNFKKLQVRPAGHDRFPSTLILRPVADGKRYFPAALALTAQTPDIVLAYGDREEIEAAVEWKLTPDLAAQILPMQDRTPQGMKTFIDPIDRFLWELKK